MPGGDFSTVFDGTVSDPEGSGTFSVALVSGQNYTMTLGNNGNISSDGGLSGKAGARSFVDWNISYNAVPEPGTWALMIGGFGLAGALLRRRRAVTG